MNNNIFYLDLNKLFIINPITYKRAITDLLEKNKEYITPKTKIIVGIWSEYKPNLVSMMLDALTTLRVNPILILLDINYKSDNLSMINCNIKYINFWICCLGKATIKHFKLSINNNKFLFLVGSPNRINRINLLYLLYKDNLLGNSIFTFPYECFDQDGHHEHFKLRNLNKLLGIDKSEFNEFIDYCINRRTILNDYFKYNSDSESELHISRKNTITEIFKDVYTNTFFSLIAETQYDSFAQISEKTIRAISYSHPFIVASTPETLTKLKSLGFKTFDNYLINSEYDSELDSVSRLCAVNNNVKYFLDNCKKYTTEIENDVKHNTELYNKIFNDDMNYLNDLFQQNDINSYLSLYLTASWNNDDEVHHYKDTYHYIAEEIMFLQRYNNIKGSDYPACNSFSDFKNLPKWIQEECINFNIINVQDLLL